MSGCLCTNFSITADSTDVGGMYKWSATISTGVSPSLNNTAVEAGTAFGNDTITSMSTLSAKKVWGLSPIVSSFGLTIDSPAVYSGVSSTGYECFGRGAETSITANATVKYDSVTRPIIHQFNTLTGGSTGNNGAESLKMTQTTATDYSIDFKSSILTDVTFNEGDVMMLDVSMKGVGLGTGNVLEIDVA